MLIDDLREQLKYLEPDLQIIREYWSTSNLEEEFKKLEQVSIQEDFWQNPDQTAILKSLQRAKLQRTLYHDIVRSYDELLEMMELFAQDETELTNLQKEVKELARAIKKFKLNILLSSPEDSSHCFFTINAGAGGTEAQDWAEMLLRMYIRFCERERFEVSILDYQPGEEAGIKSATLFIKGKNAYGLLKAEEGIHRLVRISPFDTNKRRHTSFAAVQATPETPEVEIVIDPKDIRVDTYRASGAGGQHVNKTESAVRFTHIPTGIVTQCQSERSQIQNRETAMKMLYAKLAQKQKEEQQAKLSKGVKKKIEWGSQIRSYILHPYKMVKDHRTGHESHQPELVLDGDIMEFIEKYLIQKKSE